MGLAIGEVARRSGISTSALRYYESVGLLPRPARAGGQRRYDDAALNRLAVLRAARATGFTVAEMRGLVAGFDDAPVTPDRWRTVARQKIADLEGTIRRAEVMKRVLETSLACGCQSLGACPLVTASAAGALSGSGFVVGVQKP